MGIEKLEYGEDKLIGIHDIVAKLNEVVDFVNCSQGGLSTEDVEVKKRVVKDKVLSFSDIREKEFKTLIEKTKRETCRSVLDVFRFALANTPRPQMFAKMRECIEQLEEVYGI